jgi:hypothetical protein
MLRLLASLAECVTEGQIIVLNPGRTGGALEFDKIFREKGVREKVVIAEAQTSSSLHESPARGW